MNFSKALEHLKNGEKVQRKGWKDIYIELITTTDDSKMKFSCIFLTVQGVHVVWNIKQYDVLADDWQEV